MTVAELRKALLQYPDDAEVCTYDGYTNDYYADPRLALESVADLRRDHDPPVQCVVMY